MPSSHIPVSAVSDAFQNGFNGTNGIIGHQNGHQNGHHAPERNLAKDVGILAIELYFPNTFVDQTELETFDKVSAGELP